MNIDKRFDLLIDKIEDPLEFNILVTLNKSIKTLSTNEKISLDDKLKAIGVSKEYFSIINEDTGWYSLTEKGIKLKEYSKGHIKFERKINSTPLDWYKITAIVLSVIFFGFNFYQKHNYDDLKSQHASLKSQYNLCQKELSDFNNKLIEKSTKTSSNSLESKEFDDLLIDNIPQGKNTYELYFAEFDGRMKNLPVEILISGNKITVYNSSQNPLTGGEIIMEGILLEHKSGKWIIGKTKSDQNAEEIGGCSGDLTPINFQTKIIEWC